MSINNRLQQTEAAEGVVEFAQQTQQIPLNASWFEKLNRWDEALDAYERSQLQASDEMEYTLGRMRCLQALGDWPRLHRLVKWVNSKGSGSEITPEARKNMAALGAAASWNLSCVFFHFCQKQPFASKLFRPVGGYVAICGVN